jgi:PEP-CTERM motif
MRHMPLSIALAALISGSPVLLADTIPYSQTGTIAPVSVLTATATGDVSGYFISASAADDDYVRLVDLTSGYESNYFFENYNTSAGTVASFGPVTKGDTLVFEILNQSMNLLFATDRAHSFDGLNHGYETAFGGGMLDGINLPAGTYVGMEDRPNRISDFDYNDDTFLVTNVSSSQIPEPGTLALFGTGIVGVAGVLRGKIFVR